MAISSKKTFSTGTQKVSRKRAGDKLTTEMKQKKPRIDPKQEIIDLLTCDPGSISISKLSHSHEVKYNLSTISIKKDGEFVSTNYVQCDHENCRRDLQKSIFYALKDSKPKADGTKNKLKRNDRIIKHEEKYHNDIVLHAARMIVKKGLPFDAFESPEFKEMMGLLNEDFKDGISKEEIESRLPEIAGGENYRYAEPEGRSYWLHITSVDHTTSCKPPYEVEKEEYEALV